MVNIPVALAPGDAAGQQLSAEYCTPPGPRASTVDVLVPGATYNEAYWDWPVDPAAYSFVDKDLLAHRATLAVSGLGTGASSHPVSSAITATVSAYTIHQAIAWIRHAGYQKVDLIGHSVGSIIASLVAATWPGDAGRVVLTGDLSLVSANENAAQADIWPADQDPQFAGDGLDPGYLTTVPGIRGTLFYYNGNPAVVAWDESHKDVVSATEFESALALPALPPGPANPTDGITAPVLLLVGQQDHLLCQGGGTPDCANLPALQAFEAPYFARAVSLTVLSVPRTGHDLALSPTAGLSFAMINAWINTHGAN